MAHVTRPPAAPVRSEKGTANGRRNAIIAGADSAGAAPNQEAHHAAFRSPEKSPGSTGAGSGIGRAGALALAGAGAKVVLSGRQTAPLEETAAMVREKGGWALVAPADISTSADVTATAARIRQNSAAATSLLNNAGINIRNRSWRELDAAGIDAVIGADLSGAFYAAAAVAADDARAKGRPADPHLVLGRPLHLARVGPIYTAAKHGVHRHEREHQPRGMRQRHPLLLHLPQRSGDAILDKRPVPVTAEDKARMLQVDDLAETILFAARMPPSVCLNEILISPT